MTPNKEDYLKIIFELGGAHTKVNNKQIVSGLNVSAASVSEMMSKLLKEGFVEHTPYQGVQLTDAGLLKAGILVRKHRLWEVFLVENLGYSWNEVHDEAEVLEHVTSTILSDRLEEYLEFPKNCPHGGVIPDRDGRIIERELQTLIEMKINDTIQIQRVLDDRELLDYLVSVGLEIGDQCTIIEIGAYEGPITLLKGTEKIQISHKAACNIFIQAI
ncbi:metal-dependent transcriptional regulator [Carnobacterium gallinarum]|uniref:metal-dependent transcriptional regulator n=1 Tax=Carnobacterium gallinarum TaxID=2749 RepID=UPI00054E9AEC|nr:metal-dependent transcriptional regulator [Carnobacterium gallinarum]